MCVVKRLEQDRYHTLCAQVQGSGQSNLYTVNLTSIQAKTFSKELDVYLMESSAMSVVEQRCPVLQSSAPHSCLKTLISWFRVN